MAEVVLDHTKQYRIIDGHKVVISFAQNADPHVLGRVKQILLSCSQICPEKRNNATISSDKEG